MDCWSLTEDADRAKPSKNKATGKLRKVLTEQIWKTAVVTPLTSVQGSHPIIGNIGLYVKISWKRKKIIVNISDIKLYT